MREEQSSTKIEHQASRAEYQGVPPDKDALGLVEAIREAALLEPDMLPARRFLLIALATIHDTAERLAVLLKDRDAAVEDMATALESQARVPCNNRNPQACIRKPSLDWQHWCPNCRAEYALARYRGSTS